MCVIITNRANKSHQGRQFVVEVIHNRPNRRASDSPSSTLHFPLQRRRSRSLCAWVQRWFAEIKFLGAKKFSTPPISRRTSPHLSTSSSYIQKSPVNIPVRCTYFHGCDLNRFDRPSYSEPLRGTTRPYDPAVILPVEKSVRTEDDGSRPSADTTERLLKSGN